MAEQLMQPFSELEAIIERGLSAYVETGKALDDIRASRVYRSAGYSSFDGYCFKRWGWTSGYVGRVIRASRLIIRCHKELDGKKLPGLSQAIQISRLTHEFQSKFCSELDFSTETFNTVRDLVDKTINQNPPSERISKWAELIRSCADLVPGGRLSFPIPVGRGVDEYRSALRSALEGTKQTKPFVWGTVIDEENHGIIVVKKRPRSEPEIRVIAAQERVRIASNREEEEADIPKTMCRRCGMTGEHAGYPECITALRDRIATLEIELAKASGDMKRTRLVA